MERTEGKKFHILCGWLKNNYALLLAPLLVGALYILALFQNGVYPFGNKYTAASYDLSAQIAPFIEHLFDVFDGKSTLSFSYAIVGGADVTGTFLYFFISPFSFLFLIFGDGKVAHASSVVLLCKLLCIAFTGSWFAKKLFQGIPEYLCLAVGVLYAYCGYTFVSNTYINWTDFLIYTPFAAGAFVRFVRTGKFLPFAILLACCIYTCFSIACFAMFTVYPALVIYALLCVEREGRKRFVAYLSLSFAVAILLSLPILFPALKAYSVSSRGGSLFENLWKGFTVSQETGLPQEFNSSTFLDSYSLSVYRKWSYILADSLFVCLTLIWFIQKGLKDKLAKFMLVAGILTLLPTVVDESMNLLNMGSYMSYALRFGFLNALYFLGGACLCLQGWCYKPFHAYDGISLLAEEKEEGETPAAECVEGRNRKVAVWSSLFIVLGALVVGFLAWFINDGNYQTLLKRLHIDSKNFSSAFAHSLGGLEVIAVLFLAVGLVVCVGGFLVADKRISLRLLSFVVLAVVGVQVCFYNYQLVVGNRSTQHQTLGDYQALCQQFNEREEGYFRVKDYDDAMTSCAPLTGGSNSFSGFSSVLDKDNFATFQLFGYKGNEKNNFKSAHDTSKKNRSDEFGDSFLGYKYFVSKKESLHEQEGKSYIQPMYELDEEGNFRLDERGNRIRLRQGGLYAYENTLVFPLGYTVEGSYAFVAENTNNKTNRKKNQAALYAYLRGEDLQEKTGKAFVTPESAAELNDYLRSKAAEVSVSAGKITAKVSAKKGENLLLSFVAAEGYTVTVNGRKASLIDNDLKFLLVALEEGENEVVFTYTSPYGRQALLGLLCGVVGLALVAAVLKWTKWAETLSPVIATAGVAVTIGVVAFFMLFPTGVFLTKLVYLIKLWIV